MSRRARTRTAPLSRRSTSAGSFYPFCPRSELKRIKPEYIDKYLKKEAVRGEKSAYDHR